MLKVEESEHQGSLLALHGLVRLKWYASYIFYHYQ